MKSSIWSGRSLIKVFSFWMLIESLSFHHPVTASPTDLGGYAFVASRQSSTVAMISTSDDRVHRLLQLEKIPSQIVASERDRRLIAVFAEDQTVSLIDLDSGLTKATIDLGFHPERLQIDDNAGLAAIASADAGKIAMLSISHGEVMYTLDDVRHPADVMFNRDGVHLYVAERGAGAISVFETKSGHMVKRIMLEAARDDAVELIRTPGGRTGLALHGDSGLISALDLDKGEQVGSTELPGPAVRGFPSANSQYFLIPNNRLGTMSLVSSWTYRESERMPAPEQIIGVNFAMFDTVAFALGRTRDTGSGEAVSVSLLEDRDVLTVPLPGRPETSLTVDAGTKIYVALSNRNQVAVLDARSGELLGLIDDVGNEPWAITAAGGLGYCH